MSRARDNADLGDNYGTFSGTIGSGATFPSTMIKQVVVTTSDTAFSTTSSSFTNVTGMSVNITPSSTSSKILLFFEFRHGNSSSSDNGVRILRDSTALDLGGSSTNNLGNNYTDQYIDSTFTILDQPSTNSEITYQLQVKRSVGTLYINARKDGGNVRNGTIYAMEVL